MVNNPLIRPYLLGGVALGGLGPLDSHDINLNESTALSGKLSRMTPWLFIFYAHVQSFARNLLFFFG